MSDAANQDKYLLLKRKGRILALPVDHVSEVMQCDRVFDLPVTDPRIAGLILTGDESVPLIRIDDEKSSHPRIAVLLRTPDGIVAFPADEVIRVDSLTETPMPEMPAETPGPMASKWPGILRGIGSIDQQTIFFLEPRAITAEPR